MEIGNYFNVFGASYQNACSGFSQISLPKKIAIGILTTLSGIFTVGVAALPVFRLLTENWKPKSTEITSSLGEKILTGTLSVKINDQEYKMDLAGKLISEPDYTSVNKIVITNQEGLKKIPDWVFKCKNATTLFFDNCELTECPKAIKELSKLKALTLRNAHLTALPDISTLTKLIILDLVGNPQLTTLPNLEKCSLLTRLYIDNSLKEAARKLIRPKGSPDLEVGDLDPLSGPHYHVWFTLHPS